ncbi:MAG: winged helix-turn-helix domain-containing protein [Dehalococcoidia bacterium]|nr:winged helix-turn-helix domain-containing protein [Dehalococcoidia bacterium]
MDDILRTERETRKFRLLALLILAAAVYLQHYTLSLGPVLTICVPYLAYLTLLHSTLLRRLPTEWLPYTMLVVDTGFVSGAVYVFGVESAFFAFFPILIIYYAFYMGYVGSFVAATLAAFAYIGLAYLQQADAVLGRLLPVQIPLFYLIALFCGYISQRRLHEHRELQELAMLLQAERGARSMLDLTGDVASMLDLKHLQRQILELAISAADCTYGAMALVDGGTGKLAAPVLCSSKAVAQTPSISQVKPEASTALEQEALRQGKQLEMRDPGPDMLPPWARQLAPGYAILLPLVLGGSPQGVVWLLSTKAHHDLSPTQEELLQSLVRFFVPLIGSARAYAVIQKQSQRLAGELRGAVNQIQRTQQVQKRSDVRVGQLLLEPAQMRAHLGSTMLELSAREFDVLYLLARHAGNPVSQEVLLREIWSNQPQARSNVVDVSINRLRRKLRSQAQAGELIQTVRGVGYRFDAST